jgi:guanylate kinase
MTASGNESGLLLVVSAPSGGGKGTILGRAFARDPRLRHAVSATTRARRGDEVEGQNYYFIDRPTFERWLAEGRFLEWAVVHGECYGTLKSEIDRLREEGRDVVLELDVQGMRHLRDQGTDVATVFIEPPSLEVLEQRLRARGDLTEEQLQLRLENARAEIAAKNEYDYTILNDDLELAVASFEGFVQRARKRAR